MSKNNSALPIFYICPICGNIVEMVNDAGPVPSCCGQDMELLKPGTSDGALEKHIPTYEFSDCELKVSVGAKPHPMMPEHHIAWIEIVTDMGIQRKDTHLREKAGACFHLGKNEKLMAIYSYCNTHGLWVAFNED